MAEDIAEKAYQLGKKYENVYSGCSQCTVAALQEALDIRNKDIFKATSGLAGGGACTDGSCGAYTGSIIFLSYLIGRDDFIDNADNFHKTLDMVQKLHEKFISEYGSVICRDIQTKLMGRSYYLPDPDDFEKFEKAGGHTTHCPQVTGKAAQWTVILIKEAGLL